MTETKKKPRGIIIVDTSALINMCSDVPAFYCTNEATQQSVPPQLARALFYLAAHGYKVIIPSVTALEAGNYTKSGESFSPLYKIGRAHV